MTYLMICEHKGCRRIAVDSSRHLRDPTGHLLWIILASKTWVVIESIANSGREPEAAFEAAADRGKGR